MATISKDKNYLIFTNDDDRTYKFDINTGVFYSTKGNPMKSAPSGFATYVKYNHATSNVVAFMNYLHSNRSVKYSNMANYASLIAICDRLDSVEVKLYDDWGWFSAREKDIEFAGKYFKKFVDYYKEQPEDRYKYNCITTFREEYGKALWLTEHNVKVSERLTNEMVDFMYRNKDQFSHEELSYVAYYLTHSVWDFFEDKNTYNWTSTMASKFKNYFKWCRVLEIEPKKENFFVLYGNAKKNYETNKAELDKKALAVQYGRHSKVWTLENEIFQIVLPTCKDDFKHEADTQKNCVFNFDYMSRVCNGEDYVIFIRKKTNINKPYITCEIGANGDILQYYLACNNTPTSEEDLGFKRLLADTISQLW